MNRKNGVVALSFSISALIKALEVLINDVDLLNDLQVEANEAAAIKVSF